MRGPNVVRIVRRGTPRGCREVADGRCRLHGGLSTGPETTEGVGRIRKQFQEESEP
jgi:hypothetical protein